MKKITEIILVCALAITLCSCGNASRQGTEMPSSSAENITDTVTSSAPTESKENTPSKTTSEKISAKPAHKHSFSAPTCTKAGKCSCGAISGNAKGHTWQNATCTAPKTCKVCGATEGGTAAHNISTKTSKCTVCGAFSFNQTYAVRSCLKQANQINANYFDLYRILDVCYVDTKNCICDTPKAENYITVFIYFYYESDGQSGYDLDVYDVHKNGNFDYSVNFSNVDLLYTYDNDSIVRVRSNDYSIFYDKDVLKKVNLSEVL